MLLRCTGRAWPGIRFRFAGFSFLSTTAGMLVLSVFVQIICCLRGSNLDWTNFWCVRRSCDQRPSVQQRFSISGSENRERLASTPCTSTWHHQGKVCKSLRTSWRFQLPETCIGCAMVHSRKFLSKKALSKIVLSSRRSRCLWRETFVCTGTAHNDRTNLPNRCSPTYKHLFFWVCRYCMLRSIRSWR